MKKLKSENLKSGLLNRTAQRSEGEPALPQIDFERRRLNRALPADKLLDLIRAEAPQLWELAQVVGDWVWVSFPEKQPRQVTAILCQMGFHWNNKRQVWQHPCGSIAEPSPYDPRRKYRTYFPASQTAA